MKVLNFIYLMFVRTGAAAATAHSALPTGPSIYQKVPKEVSLNSNMHAYGNLLKSLLTMNPK
jgi:hypothetical protein